MLLRSLIVTDAHKQYVVGEAADSLRVVALLYLLYDGVCLPVPLQLHDDRRAFAAVAGDEGQVGIALARGQLLNVDVIVDGADIAQFQHRAQGLLIIVEVGTSLAVVQLFDDGRHRSLVLGKRCLHQT